MFPIGGALSHCAVIALAEASTGWVQPWLDWQNKTSAASWFRHTCGLLAIATGIYLLASAR